MIESEDEKSESFFVLPKNGRQSIARKNSWSIIVQIKAADPRVKNLTKRP